MKFHTALIVTGFIASSWSAAAIAGDAGFLQDSQGGMVKDGFGECVSVIKIKHKHGGEGEHTHCGDTPKKAEAPKPKPEPKAVVLKNISLGAHALFDVNSADLRAAGKAELDELASALGKVKRVDSVSIVGHTDSSGAASYNQGLSERRANAVSSYLSSKGVSSSVISTSGRGEDSPVADNATKAGRQKNRRVDIVVKGVE